MDSISDRGPRVMETKKKPDRICEKQLLEFVWRASRNLEEVHAVFLT